jgi:hypothetical protein
MNNSKHVKHILGTWHEYGRTEDSMDNLKITLKESNMDTREQYIYIYLIQKD